MRLVAAIPATAVLLESMLRAGGELSLSGPEHGIVVPGIR
jgi:hypothetical protein